MSMDDVNRKPADEEMTAVRTALLQAAQGALIGTTPDVAARCFIAMFDALMKQRAAVRF